MSRFTRTLAGLLATTALVGGAAQAATALAPGETGPESGQKSGQERVTVVAGELDAFDWE